jgi:hypothetical protein
VIDGSMTSVAALRELVVGGDKFLRILLLDGCIDRADGPGHCRVNEFGHWQSAKLRLRLGNAIECLPDFYQRIGCERPILVASGKSELAVARCTSVFIMSPMVIA